MKDCLIKTLFIALDVLGINFVFRLLNAKRLRVLMYHGVTSETMSTFYWTQLSLRKFRTQMEILKKRYNVISAASMVSGQSDEITYPNHSVIVTFDDGYENVFTEARKVLHGLELPATIFVVTELSQSGQIIWTDLLYTIFITHFDTEIDLTGFGLKIHPKCSDRNMRAESVEQVKTALKSYSEKDRQAVMDHLSTIYPLNKSDYLGALRLMSVEQIVELSKSGGIQIASHSHHHPILSTLSLEQQSSEIDMSVSILSSWQLPKSHIFAYPNGRPQDFNEHTISALKSAGIRAAVTTVDGFYDPADGPYRIRRIPIGADMNSWEYRARLSGLYYFLLKIAGIFRF